MNWILTEGCKGQGRTRLRNKHEQRHGLVKVHGVAWEPEYSDMIGMRSECRHEGLL